MVIVAAQLACQQVLVCSWVRVLLVVDPVRVDLQAWYDNSFNWSWVQMYSMPAWVHIMHDFFLLQHTTLAGTYTLMGSSQADTSYPAVLHLGMYTSHGDYALHQNMPQDIPGPAKHQELSCVCQWGDFNATYIREAQLVTIQYASMWMLQ